MASISGLLDTSRQALNAQTQSIRVVGDNIANVNTDGYTRRRGDLVTGKASGGAGVEVGTGVSFERSVRIADKFLNDELIARISDKSFAEIRDEVLSRAESPFSLDGSTGRIGTQFNEFFGALEDLQVNPADIPLRTQVIQKGNDLVISIRETYNQISTLQREADDRLGILVEDVNRLSSSIAELNFEITKADTPDQEALTLRDQRDQLMRDLGELVSYESVENTDGTVLIYLSNGFSLVNSSTSRDLGVTASPGFPGAPTFPPGLDGNPLRHVVFNFGAGVDQELTQVLASGSGEIGGLLSLRGVQPSSAAITRAFDASGDLVNFATNIEYMTRDLLTRINETYNGPDADDTDVLPFPVTQPSAGDLDGNPTDTVGDFASVYSLFSFEGIENIAPVTLDQNGRPQEADLNIIMDSDPTISSFSRILTFNVSDERELATARDIDLVTGAGGTPGLQVSTGDSSNIEALLADRDDSSKAYNQLGTNRAAGVPQITFQGTRLEDLYGLTVSAVGGVAARAADDLVIFEQRESQVRELQQSVSGVNLDEEFSKLINFQRGFEAAARMIRVGDELFQQIIGLLG